MQSKVLKLTYSFPFNSVNPCIVGNSFRSIGVIAGGVAVGAALLFAAPVIVFVYWKRRKPPDYFFDIAG